MMMQTFPTTQAFDLSEDQRNTLTHCLRISAERFTEHATICRRDTPPLTNLAIQFERQAAEAESIADRIESAEYVKLGREVE